MPEYEEQQDEQAASTRPFWSGTITFGLVSIPVNLFPANRGARVSLRMLGPKGKPLSRRYYSEKTGEGLSDDDIVRGYEIEKDKYVVIGDDELERLAPEKSRDIDLRRFVKAEQIPKLYFERGYFLAPAGGSAKAYRLLAETMEQTGRAGVATFVMRGKEYLIAILSDNGILRAETLRFQDEVRSPDDIGLPAKPKTEAKQVKAFEKIIEQRAAASLPEREMHDDDTEKVRKLIDRKRNDASAVKRSGKKGAKTPAPAIDLLEVLKQALGEAAAKPRARRSA